MVPSSGYSRTSASAFHACASVRTSAKGQFATATGRGDPQCTNGRKTFLPSVCSNPLFVTFTSCNTPREEPTEVPVPGSIRCLTFAVVAMVTVLQPEVLTIKRDGKKGATNIIKRRRRPATRPRSQISKAASQYSSPTYLTHSFIYTPKH